LICDLHHVSAPAIRLAVKAKGVENITMISDSSKFCGMGDGDYVVGNHTMIL
jgi:N-acetylglucosamine-6-phosphate deacetylase